MVYYFQMEMIAREARRFGKHMKAMVQKRYLILPEPGEGDKRADMDRLLCALEPEFGAVRLEYGVLARDCAVIRSAEYRVTAVLVWCADAWTLVGIQPGDSTARRYALACDLGSTTVAVQLIDLNAGAVVATETAVNAQVALGTDILTRIFYTREPGQEAARRAEMRALAVETIGGCIGRLLARHGVDAADCPAMVLAGNTTMTHFLLGIDAFCVFSAPFAPAFNAAPVLNAAELGFDYSGKLYCFPSAANYLGGDIVSGLLSTGVMDGDGLSLFVDIGTNGEMAIGCRDFLVAGAGAAGPALEGGISEFGMRAAPGAVNAVRIAGGELQITTIGGEAPRGICGSGIVDLLAEMFKSGWMDARGALVPGAAGCICPVGRGERPDELAVFYAEQSALGCPLSFTQSDIAQFTNTKAAAHTMVACLLEAAGVAPEQLQRVYLAGGFGEFLNLESAVTIGLYPDLPREKFVSAGNASLSGARSLLLDRGGFDAIRRILDHIYYVEFAMQPNFLDLMQAAKFYPHTNAALYPSVKAPSGGTSRE